MTSPEVRIEHQESTDADPQIQRSATTQSTGEFHIPVSELWVWQHKETRDAMRRAKEDVAEGRTFDLSEYLERRKPKD